MTRPDIEFIAHQDTPTGTLILCKRPNPSKPGTTVTELTLDHEFLMSSHITFSERALSRVALEMHAGKDLNVLVGGLGLGYTAWEVVQSPRVARVEVVELEAAVIKWLNEGLVPLSDQLVAEPRVDIVEADVFEKLSQAPESAASLFDLILIDVDHSPADHLGNSQNDTFYTADGLRAARRHLAPGGVFGVWSYAESSPFAGALRDVFREVRLEPVPFMNDLTEEAATDWLFFAHD